jgi:Type II secretion system (T2SS), protein E, N-terminal domain
MKDPMNGSVQPRKASWRDLWEKLAPLCGHCDSVHLRSKWRRMRRRSRGVRMQGARYCRTECLELALVEVLARARPAPRVAAIASHRIPLGLLLLSRHQLTAAQLRIGLAAQSAAGHGKIGAWLRELGFTTEREVTAALARQWSCPVLRNEAAAIGAGRFPAIPALLLESFQMIPVDLVEATGTLLMAFSEGIDYTALYAIEHMLGYHTETCLVSPTTLHKSLQALAQRRASGDITFDRVEDAAECAHIICSYAVRVGAQEVRWARCGKHLWIRLERPGQEATNLVLSAPEQSKHNSPVPHAVAASPL